MAWLEGPILGQLRPDRLSLLRVLGAPGRGDLVDQPQPPSAESLPATLDRWEIPGAIGNGQLNPFGGPTDIDRELGSRMYHSVGCQLGDHDLGIICDFWRRHTLKSVSYETAGFPWRFKGGPERTRLLNQE